MLIEHRLVAGSANAPLYFLRREIADQYCGDPITDFNPALCGLKNIRRSVFAVKNFAPKPFGRIDPADFCQVLRTMASGCFRNEFASA